MPCAESQISTERTRIITYSPGLKYAFERGTSRPRRNGPVSERYVMKRLSAVATKYFAFLSYSHADIKVATTLARFLETFKVPVRLGGKEQGLPKRMSPVFRDRDDLSGSSDLGTVLRTALAESGALIVLCSPDSAKSKWVNEEIREFRSSTAQPQRIYPVLLSGEPSESFPAALTETGLEPLAIDFREHHDRPRDARLRLVAALLNVDFDALKRRDQVRRRNLGVRWAFGLAAILCIFAVGLNRLQSQQLVTAGQYLAKLSRERPPDNVPGAMLAVQAYRTAPSDAAAGALLYHLKAFPGLAHAQVPWRDAVFANHGQMLGLITDQAEDTIAPQLTVLRSTDLAVTLPPTSVGVRAKMVCGFRANSTALLSDGNVLFTANLSTGRSSVVPFAGHNISALACMPDGNTALISLNRNLESIDIHSAKVRHIAVLPQRVTDINVSHDGSLLALISQDRIDLLTYPQGRSLFHTVGIARYGKTCSAILGDPMAPRCGEFTVCNAYCGAIVSFSADDKQIAWCSGTADGGTSVEIAQIRTLPARKTYAAQCPLPVTSLVLGGNYLISSGYVYSRNAEKHRYDIAYRYDDSPIADQKSVLWSDDLVLFAIRDANGVETRSLVDRNAPQLGAQQASLWGPNDHALQGSLLILAGKSTIHRYDLTRFRTQFDEAGDVSDSKKLRDAGDGKHFISLDVPSGTLQVLEITSLGNDVIATFHLPPIGLDNHRRYLDNPDIAYDPQHRTATFLGKSGLRVFSVGHGEETDAESTFVRAVQRSFGKDWLQAGPDLTPQGTFVSFPAPPDPPFATDKKAPGEPGLWPVDGKGSPLDLEHAYLSPDEKIAIQSYVSGSLVYTLPSGKQIGGPLVTRYDLLDQGFQQVKLALSFDHKQLAYMHGFGGKSEIVLYDFMDRTEIASLPWGKAAITEMFFSADGKYLMVRNDDNGWANFVVISVDPHDWMRGLCLAAGRALTQSEISSIGGVSVDPQPCRAFGSDMLPQQTPSK